MTDLFTRPYNYNNYETWIFSKSVITHLCNGLLYDRVLGYVIKFVMICLG